VVDPVVAPPAAVPVAVVVAAAPVPEAVLPPPLPPVKYAAQGLDPVAVAPAKLEAAAMNYSG